MLKFSEKVNPRSDVNTNADVGMIAISNHQEKTALFREEDSAFTNSLMNMTQKKSENSSRTKLFSGNQKKVTSELSQWSDDLQVENVITLYDFDKWRKNGIDEALQSRCNLTLNQGTHRKKNFFSSEISCNFRVEARRNWARRPTQFRLTVHL